MRDKEYFEDLHNVDTEEQVRMKKLKNYKAVNEDEVTGKWC